MTKNTIDYVQQIRDMKVKKLKQTIKYYAVGIVGGLIGAGTVYYLLYMASKYQALIS